MEVHAHTHTARKKWTHYFWDFLMLFLAVFCGFLAENQREHMIEQRREKQYISSLIRDISLDTTSLHQALNTRIIFIRYYDSLVLLLKHYTDSNLNDIYYYARHVGRIPDFRYHDRTIQQLKSSGSLRLIRNKDVADSITIYDNEMIKQILTQQEIEPRFRNDVLQNQIGKIFDGFTWNEVVDSLARISRPVHNPKLFSKDPALLNDFIVHIVTVKTAYRLTNAYIEEAINAAEKLIALLKKEYYLE